MTEPTMLRGTKIRLYPNKAQAATMDLWRRRCRELWNLLLDLQHAAYNGENTRSKLGWRKTWASVVTDDLAAAEQIYRHGKRRKDGHWIKEPGEGREEEREALKFRLKELEKQNKKQTSEFLELKEKIKAIAAKPVPPNPEFMERIRWTWRWDGAPLRERLMHKMFGYLAHQQCDHTYKHTLAWLKRRGESDEKAEEVIAWLQEHDGPCDCKAATASKEIYAGICKEYQPRLLWTGQSAMMTLQKIMARLKQHPQTHWIADLPSHAAQKIVSDMVGAIDAMLRERGKRTSGAGGQNTGFPRWKPNHYAAGSVYFANTQLKFEAKPKGKNAEHPDGIIKEFARVKLPNGIGWIDCRLPRKIAAAHEYGDADLQGGRIWRQGEDWYMSCQWKVPHPPALPATGRVAAVKVAASIPITIYEEGRPLKEYALPAVDKDLMGRHKHAARKQARALMAAEERRKDKLTYRQRRHKQKLAAGISAKAPKVRKKLTPGFYKAAAVMAACEAADANVRDDWLHKVTTQIVRTFDVIAVQKMEVAKMMKKPRAVDDGEKRSESKRRSLKAARVMMRRAAMSRIQQTLKYKAVDLRGEQAYEEIDPHDVTVSASSITGTVFPEWRDGRKVVYAREELPDGDVAITHLARNRNAARLVSRELTKRLKQRGVAKKHVVAWSGPKGGSGHV